MQISSIGFNNNFKGSENVIEVRRDSDGVYSQEPDQYTFTQENADKLEEVAKKMDAKADKVTNPLKYFTVSAIMATLAFMVGKNATSRILSYGFDNVKPIPKYINGLRNKIGDCCVTISEKIKDKKIIGNVPKWLEKFGQDAFEGISEENLSKVFTGANSKLKQSVLGGINKALALGVGTGAAALNITKRYEDKDKNGIPDRAEHAIFVLKESSEALKAIANAAGLV